MGSVRDGDGDQVMDDSDPYNTDKYTAAMRPTLNVQSDSARYTMSSPTSAATPSQKYSPMDISPPTPPAQAPPYSTLTSDPHQSARQPRPAMARLSPGRQAPYYSSPVSRSSTSHPNQLPPMQSPMTPRDQPYPQSATVQLNAVFGRDYKSPQTHEHRNSVASRGQTPRFVPCNSSADLQPKVNAQPPFRRANPEGGFISPLQALTTHLPSTYRMCNPGFQYESSRNPRRVLTKPSKGTKNDGFDNEDSDHILHVNDILGSEETSHKNRYLILDVLGQGTFGQVVKCQNLRTQEVVAVKVVKNRTAYFNQSMMEVSVLDLLNSRMDKNDDHHILRLKDTFIHRQHLCLVFELLSVNLYELIKQNQFRGLSTTLVRVFAQQLLNGLCLLSKARLIHCDLKPENILLKNLESPIIKIIDFGSACDERQTVYTYIQSRFYRSPEVLLGLPYSAAIDMWSLGCIVVELFLGLPLFPGSSEYNQISRITEMLGLPPTWMLEVGKQSGEFFDKAHDELGRRMYRLKTMEQYSRDHGNKEQPSKKYFAATTLPEIIKNYPMPRKEMKQAEVDREMSNRIAFIDFVHGLLNINPLERWTPQQARTHPFITQQKFTGPFQPQMSLRTSTSRAPAPGVQQQQQAEALSKQRAQAQAQQVQQSQHAVNAAYSGMRMQNPANYHPSSPHATHSPQTMYGAPNMYSPSSNAGAGQLPPYPSSYGGQMAVQQPMGAHVHAQQHQQYASASAGSSLYTQATMRASRARASTMESNNMRDPNTGIPPALQRVASHLNPNAPIRSQPSPAYYPPPPSQLDGYGGVVDGHQPPPMSAGGHGDQRRHSGRDRNDPNRQSQNFVRQLEDRTLEEGWVGNNGGRSAVNSAGGGWG